MHRNFSIVASFYKLLKADSHKVLLRSVGNATQVNGSTEVIKGNLDKPSLPYEREEVTVLLDDIDSATVFGIIVSDDEGNESPMSNLVVVTPRFIEKPAEDIFQPNIALIVGVTVPVLMIVIAAVIAVVVVRLKRTKSTKYASSGQHNNKAYA